MSAPALAPTAAAEPRRPQTAPPRGSTPTPNGLWRGGLLFSLGQAAALAMGFVGSMLLVRVGTQATVGSYLLVLRAVAAVAIVLQVGLVPAVLRFVPLSRGEGGARAMPILRRRLFTLQLGAWLLVTPLVLLLWPWIVEATETPELAGAGPLVALTGVAVSFSAVADAYLRSLRLYGTSAVLSQLFVRSGLIVAFVALLVQGSLASWQLLAGIFASLHVAAALCFAAAVARARRLDAAAPGLAQPPPAVRTLFSTVGVMGLRNGVAALIVSWDLWILAWARPAREVAVYGVMMSLVQVIAILPAVANLVIPQEFAVLHRQGRLAELEGLARTAATLVGLLSGAALLLLALAGEPFIRIAFGPAYAGGWVLLLILAGGRAFDAMCGAAGYLLQMTGHHLVLMVTTAVAALLNVAAAMLLAPRWGGLGVALATTTTLVLLNLVLVGLARRRVGVLSFAFVHPAEWLATARRCLGGAR